jgi:hypothetical protein
MQASVVALHVLDSMGCLLLVLLAAQGCVIEVFGILKPHDALETLSAVAAARTGMGAPASRGRA